MAAADPSSWWQRLGGPNAISLPAWWLTLPGAILTAPTLAGRPSGTQALAWFALGFVAQLAVGAVLWLAWLTVLRPVGRPSRPWAFVGVVLLAGVVRGVILGVVSIDVGLAERSTLVLRIIGAPWPLLLWTGLATLIVDGTRRHRRTMASLRRALGREQELVAESATRLREHRARIVQQVSVTVTEQLQGAAQLTGDPRRAAERLQQIVRDVVRPLSHELEWRTVQDDRLLDEVAEASEPSAIPFGDYVEAAVTYRPFNPQLTGAIVLGTSVILALRGLGPLLGALLLLVDVGVVMLATYAARGLLMTHLSAWTVPVRAATVGLAVLAIAVIDAIAVILMLLITGSVERADQVMAPPVIVVVVAFVALAAQLASMTDGAVTSCRRTSEQELRDATTAVEHAASRFRQRAFLEQQQLGRLLHGEVQARIVSLALQLQFDPPADSTAAIAELDDRIQQALAEQGGAAWRTHLGDLTEMWSHAIELGVEVDEQAADRLDVDASAAEAVVAVIREGVTNAVRHGGADVVRVDVAIDGDLVVIRVDDDGTSASSATHEGLGMRMYDSLCLDWSLDVDHGGRLTARVAAASSSSLVA